MPIDASIYNIDVPKFATLGDIANARAQRQQVKSLNAERDSLTAQRQAAAAKAAKDQAEADAADKDLQASIGAHQGPDGVDWEPVIAEMYQKHPKLAETLETHVADTRKKATDDFVSSLTAEEKKNKLVADVLDGATPETLVTRLPRLAGIDPQTFQDLRQNPTQEAIDAAVNRGRSDAEKASTKAAILAEKKDAQQTALRLISVASSPEDVQTGIDYGKTHGVKMSELGFADGMDPSMASSKAFAALGQAITPEQRQTAKDRADTAAALAARTLKDDTRADEKLALDKLTESRLSRQATTGGASGPITSDVKESVAGMKDGTLPPQLPGRASKDYTAIMAEAHRQGYDLAGAVTDWAATQKHIATMNGAQQLRLNQAINQLPELLDSIDDLSAKWKGGRFPILNKANLAAAKGGVYGRDVASVANQLDAQIADVTSDLGAVYMGGNSPTDKALDLASKALKSEWDQKVLKDMVKLARNNVQIRHNSIMNTGVQGASANNPYGNQAEQPPPTGRYNPATGKVDPVR